MNREELIARFEKYDFRDSQGHPLINCLDFQMLIDQVLNDAAQVRSLERVLCARQKQGQSDEN